MAESGRGGRRQRRIASKSKPARIDEARLANLIQHLSPDSSARQQHDALMIVIRGIESFRENGESTLGEPGWIQDQRRALIRLMKGKAEADPPFYSMLQFKGWLYGAGPGGLVQIEDKPFGPIKQTGLHGSISNKMRTAGMAQQILAGHRHIDPNILFNPLTGNAVDGRKRTMADTLIDDLAHAREWDVELAAHVFFALTRALSIRASTSWYDIEPDKVGKGWNFGRLLRAACLEAGLTLPTSRNGMEKLMKKGRACALEPAITFSDGRSMTALEIEFPEFRTLK